MNRDIIERIIDKDKAFAKAKKMEIYMTGILHNS